MLPRNTAVTENVRTAPIMTRGHAKQSEER